MDALQWEANDQGFGEIAAAVPGDDRAHGGEQRMHMRAYDIWLNAPRRGEFPAWRTVMSRGRHDFGNHALLLDIAHDIENPQIIAIGEILRSESGIGDGVNHVRDIPGRSLASRLSDQFFQSVANRAPVGIEAEFVDNSGRNFLYRSILLPCSSDGDAFDVVLGIINWKQQLTPMPKPRVKRPKAPGSKAPDPKSPDPKSPDKDPAPHDFPEAMTAATMPAAIVPISAPSQDDNVAESPSSERAGDLLIASTLFTKEFLMTYESKLQECMEIDGAMAVALVDLSSGMALATAGDPRGVDLAVAAAGNSNVVRAKLATMKDLGLKDTLEDILITLSSQYHLIRVVTSETGQGLFIYLMLDKAKANLAMARFKLNKIEQGLTI
jgi:hypothetical protein